MTLADIAKEFCIQISVARESIHGARNKMGLITFGTNITLKVDFGSPSAFRACTNANYMLFS